MTTLMTGLIKEKSRAEFKEELKIKFSDPSIIKIGKGVMRSMQEASDKSLNESTKTSIVAYKFRSDDMNNNIAKKKEAIQKLRKLIVAEYELAVLKLKTERIDCTKCRSSYDTSTFISYKKNKRLECPLCKHPMVNNLQKQSIVQTKKKITDMTVELKKMEKQYNWVWMCA